MSLEVLQSIRVDAGAIATRPDASRSRSGSDRCSCWKRGSSADCCCNGRIEVVSRRTSGDEGDHHRRSGARV
ncbi:hypothetical protein [Halalkalicoccus salilacus]|uniref:hypothetical protein n=1 Tax=Halalkalicoccus sp. GCM10025704 TaxID=3252662 RepID=UPI0036108D3E